MINFGFSLVRVGERCRLTVVSDSRGKFLDDLVVSAPADFEELLQRWEQVCADVTAALSATDDLDEWAPAATLSFDAPTVRSPAIYCAGANYRDHVSEMGFAAAIRSFHFVSPPSVINRPDGDVMRPHGVKKFDWEVELVAVIGTRARNVSKADALDYVAGYTIANDVSARDDDKLMHPIFGVDWMFVKNGDGMTPVGPRVVPAALIPDPGNLKLSLRVNGELRQDSNTSFMMLSIAEQIEALSATTTLHPGDLILTGTPSGTGASLGKYLDDGDQMVAEIESIGELSNRVVGS